MAEGAELIRTALDSGTPVESVYLSPDGDDDDAAREICRRAAAAGARVFSLGPGVLERVADTVTPQPILAVLPMLEEPPAGTESWAARAGTGSLVVVLVDVRDPGNAGTVLPRRRRLGLRGRDLRGRLGRPLQPEDRAGLGRLPLPRAARRATRSLRGGRRARAAGFRTVATVLRDGEDYAALDWSVPTALFLGNESSGLDPSLQRALAGSLAIPMVGRAESLNVGVACAVVCFEAFRQRRGGGPAARSIAGSGTT